MGRYETRRIGVVDIGSNSVRMVIYEVAGRSMAVRLNEKVIAGLGRGLSKSGQLNPEGRKTALACLDRFARLMVAHEVTKILAFATAAVRDASDGAAFCADVKRTTDIDIRVLTGEDEARYASLGVIAMLPDAEGVCGDLGGSSLELSVVRHGAYENGETYPLGPLALQGAKELDNLDMGKLVSQTRDMLANAIQLEGGKRTFYAVGGAWRAIAKLHMDERDYPLRLLQAYVMNADGLLDLTKRLRDRDAKLMAKADMLVSKRSANLHLTAMVLHEVVKAGGFDRIVVSSYGAREGIVFDDLNPFDRQADPLLEGVRLLGQADPIGAGFGEALSAWLRDAARHTLSPRLVEAACLMADIGAEFHPHYRASLSYDYVISAPLAGVTHRDRACIAQAVGSRYRSAFRHEVSDVILENDLFIKARSLGVLMKLGAQLSGRTRSLLERSTIVLSGEELILTVENDASYLLSELVDRRFRRAADMLGVTPVIRLAH